MHPLLERLPIIRDPATRRFIKQIPLVWHVRRAERKIRRAYYRKFGEYRLRKMLATNPRKRVVIGAWDRYDPDWIPTQKDFLNLLDPAQWERFFQPHSVEAMLAEHVWEHLTYEEGLAAARTCFKYLSHGGHLRVAVPDGLHPDPAYIELVKADSPVPNDHKVLYTYRTLKALFESSGFKVKLYEYFDEAGTFHEEDWDEKAGTIWRARRFDPRNGGGKLVSVYPGSLDSSLRYSSIVLDAVKERRRSGSDERRHTSRSPAPIRRRNARLSTRGK